jgi:hypothetical protein
MPIIYTKLSWLWFLPALFIDSCINYSLLAWTQRRSAGKPIDWKIDAKYLAGLSLAMLVWALPNIFLAEKNSGTTSLLPMVVTLFCVNIVIFVV